MAIAPQTNWTAASPLHQYASLLLRLHDLMAAGEGDAQEADALRDQMDKPWYEMSEEERQVVGGLSEDLYRIAEGEASRVEMTAAELENWQAEAASHSSALEQRVAVSAVGDFLAFLRRPCPQRVPLATILLHQAQCWTELGQVEVASRFRKMAESSERGHGPKETGFNPNGQGQE